MIWKLSKSLPIEEKNNNVVFVMIILNSISVLFVMKVLFVLAVRKK